MEAFINYTQGLIKLMEIASKKGIDERLTISTLIKIQNYLDSNKYTLDDFISEINAEGNPSLEYYVNSATLQHDVILREFNNMEWARLMDAVPLFKGWIDDIIDEVLD